jgi:hypothetical protein
MVNTFEMCDPKTTSIDEKHLVNVKAKMLELKLTQLSKHEEESALQVVCPRMDQLVWIIHHHPLMLAP